MILVYGLFPNTLSERTELALKLLVEWAEASGLSINPSKTELILFHKGYKTPSFKLPNLKGAPIQLSNQAKFLGVILDSRKQIWKKEQGYRR